MNHLPLKGLTVLELSQYLSGPSAGLRLADLGARVIKIEQPAGGDACRQLSLKNLWVGGDSLLFHTINRNKESFAADLQNPDDLALVKRLIEEADVVTHNFRPGVMGELRLDYASVREINPRIIYAEITGFGKKGPWKEKPEQDLLLQAMSGLAYASGNGGDDPVPFGIAIADLICGAHLVQGILGALIRRHKRGKGALIEVSLLESLLDLQFEFLTTYYSSRKQPQRSSVSNGNPLLSAPYGIYRTADGFIGIAMVSLQRLASSLHCEALQPFAQEEAFGRRDEIKRIISAHLATRPSAYWLGQLHKDGIWAMEVMDWKQMKQQTAYQALDMERELFLSSGKKITTTRCPVRINGKKLFSGKPAPRLGEHTGRIKKDILLKTP